eukprot:scaffold2058_cov115-Isochrysis_galbana.AAC.22
MRGAVCETGRSVLTPGTHPNLALAPPYARRCARRSSAGATSRAASRTRRPAPARPSPSARGCTTGATICCPDSAAAPLPPFSAPIP